MTTAQLLLWTALMLVGFAGSALYSGMETGAYTLNRIRLHVQAEQHTRSAVALRRLLDDQTGLLSTLLIGNNIANYLGTGSLAVILNASGLSDTEQIILNTLLVTPILFVFGETLPKDLFAAHADRLMYPLQRVLSASRWLFRLSGLCPLTSLFSDALMRMLGMSGAPRTFHPRRQVETLMKEGVGYGLLSDEQSQIVERVLSLRDRRVGQTMTPWRRVLKVRLDDKPKELWDLARRTDFARFPVIGRGGRVEGVLYLVDVLVHRPDTCPPMEQAMRPMHRLSQRTPLRQALKELQDHQLDIALVTNRSDAPVGVVTIKDLVQPITGQLPGW